MTHAHKTSLRRTACDFCRAHKLKCLRDAANQPKCNRCTRLNRACQVGKAGRPGRPRKQDSAGSAISTFSISARPVSVRDASDEHRQPAEGQARDSFPELEPTTSRVGASINGEGGDQARGTGEFQSIPQMPVYQEGYGCNTTIDVPELSSPSDSDPGFGNNYTTTPQHACMRDLSQLNIELHSQTTMFRETPEFVNIFTYFCVPSPQEDGSSISICEKIVIYAQRLNRIMSSLDGTRKSQAAARQQFESAFNYQLDSFLATPFVSYEPSPPLLIPMARDDEGYPALDTPVVLLLVSCYAQILELLEGMFVFINERLDIIETEPLPDFGPTLGLHVGAFTSYDARTGGLVFIQVITCLLDRIEHGLGLPPDPKLTAPVNTRPALLSNPHHFELLYSELGKSGAEDGATRPRALRDTMGQARLMLASDLSW